MSTQNILPGKRGEEDSADHSYNLEECRLYTKEVKSNSNCPSMPCKVNIINLYICELAIILFTAW